MLASVFSTVCDFVFLFVCESKNITETAEWICAKFTGKTCFIPCPTSLKVKVKGQGHQGQKQHFLALSAACVWFMFGKTSLASSFISVCIYCPFSTLTLLVGRQEGHAACKN